MWWPPPSYREEEDDGVVRLPDRRSQKRTGTPGCTHPVLLRYLHPSGPADVYLFQQLNFYLLIWHSPHMLFSGWDKYTVYNSYKLLILTDWIPPLCPSPAQHGGERGF